MNPCKNYQPSSHHMAASVLLWVALFLLCAPVSGAQAAEAEKRKPTAPQDVIEVELISAGLDGAEASPSSFPSISDDLRHTVNYPVFLPFINTQVPPADTQPDDPAGTHPSPYDVEPADILIYPEDEGPHYRLSKEVALEPDETGQELDMIGGYRVSISSSLNDVVDDEAFIIVTEALLFRDIEGAEIWFDAQAQALKESPGRSEQFGDVYGDESREFSHIATYAVDGGSIEAKVFEMAVRKGNIFFLVVAVGKPETTVRWSGIDSVDRILEKIDALVSPPDTPQPGEPYDVEPIDLVIFPDEVVREEFRPYFMLRWQNELTPSEVEREMGMIGGYITEVSSDAPPVVENDIFVISTQATVFRDPAAAALIYDDRVRVWGFAETEVNIPVFGDMSHAFSRSATLGSTGIPITVFKVIVREGNIVITVEVVGRPEVTMVDDAIVYVERILEKIGEQ